MEKRDYLIRFEYDHYCQGWDECTETVLVRATSFEKACEKIQERSVRFNGARNFKNMTIE